jgi:hypothetical protein
MVDRIFLSTVILSVISCIFYSIGLFTYDWITYKESSLQKYIGLFGECVGNKYSNCTTDIYMIILIIEIIGFVFLIHSCVLSGLLLAFRRKIEYHTHIILTIWLVIYNWLTVAIIIGGWASFIIYSDEHYKLIDKKFNFSSSFYLILVSFCIFFVSFIPLAVKIFIKL